MNTCNYIWSFESVLGNKFCDEVIEHALSKKRELGLVDRYNQENTSLKKYKEIKKTRNSNIVWLNDLWIYKEIQPYVHIANKNAGWNYNWSRSESCQFTIYKPGQHYNWHFDSLGTYPNDHNNIKEIGLQRKISLTVQLSDPLEYSGGELEFDFRNYNPDKRDVSKHVIKPFKQYYKKGSITLFPSWLWHRVKPVTIGTRYSLVMWNLGDPFK